MKRILMFLLASPCFMLATPEYRTIITFVKNFRTHRPTYRLQPDVEVDCKFSSNEHGYEYALKIKIISVVNNKANLEYLMNRQTPNPTSHQAYKSFQVDTDLLQQIPCVLDTDDAALWVKIDSADQSSCIIL